MLEKRIRERYGSNMKLAKELHPAWKRVEPKAAKKQAIASLATQIGRLIAGVTTWWKNHPKASEELAELLELEVEDLFPTGAHPTVDQRLPFPEFPMLKPLALHEEPFAVSGHGWLASLIATEANQHRWITAPAGAGKSLVIRWLASKAELRGGVIGRSVRTLGEAIEIADPARPLVVEVEQAEPRADREALRLLGLRTQATTVLAAFPIPRQATLRHTSPDPTVPSWSRPSDNHADSNHGPTWGEMAWRGADDWRLRFLFWIQERLADSARDHLFDANEVVIWLNQHDPEEVLVRTPGEVLALSSVAFVRGLPKERSLVTVAEHFRDRLVAGTSANTEESRHFWRHFGGRTWNRIHGVRWENLGDSLSGLSDDAWERLIPDELTPPHKAADVRKPLMEIAAARGARARKQKVEEVSAEILVPARTQVIAMFKEDGILRGAEDGRLALFPRFAVEGSMLSCATQNIRNRHADWGTWAANEARSKVVDEVLHALPAAELREAVRRAVRTFDKTKLSSVAAIEALFSTSAQRLVDDPDLAKGRIEEFQRLGIAQAELLFDPWNDPFNPHYLTRTRYREGQFDRATWYCDSWAFTLRVPRPDGFTHPALEWRFPGWTESLSLARLPRNMPSTYWQGNSGEHVVPPEIVTLAMLACEVVPRCSDATLPVDLQGRLLLPAALLVAPEKNWSIQGRHIRALGRAWDANFLAWALEQLPRGEREAVIRWLWPACLDVRRDPLPPRPEEQADFILRLAWLLWDVPGIFQVVTENVPLELVAQSMRDFGVTSNVHAEAVTQLFPALPERLRLPILRFWANPPGATPPNFADVREMLELIHIDDVELLLELAGTSDRSATAEYTQLIWRHDAARALKEARDAVRTGSEGAQAWCWFSNDATNSEVLDELEALGTPPSWAHRWALNRLSKGGPLATRLYALLSRVVDGT